ncbi:MAG: VWA domain-containing protein [Acidimicrobiia bacterium]
MARRPLPTRGLVACVAALVALSGLAGVVRSGGPAGAQERATVEIGPVDVESHPEVTAVVTVPGGLEGVGYPPQAFEVLEDGSPVDVGVERLPTTNLEVMLVFDTSGSMEGPPLDAARQAAAAFVAAMPPEVRIGVVSFGPSPTLLTSPTPDRTHVATQIGSLAAAGETALYDAVTHAASQFSPRASDRAIVLLSDGGDTVSGATLDDAVLAVDGLRVNVIDLVTPESNRVALDELAAAGGGTVSSADPAALADVYRATASALVNRYRIAYTSDAHGPVDLTVRVDTGAGVISDSHRVEMPPAPAPDATPGEPAPRAASDGEGVLGRWGLTAGAAAMFVALVLLGLVLVPDDRRSRLARLGLRGRGLGEPQRRAPSASEVSERVASAADAFLERRGRRQGLAAALEIADISLRPGEFVVIVAAVTLIAALLGVVVAGPLGLVAALVLVPLGAWVIVGRMGRRRRERFGDQLPDTLQLLTSSLRAGYGLLQGLDSLAREAPEPARSEFGRVLLEIRVGRDPGAALHALAGRMRSDDFDWVVGAIDINREVGGDLAMVLDRVGGTIRERQRLVRQMRALTAEGRMSAYVLTALPPLLMLAMAALNPDYLADLTSGFGLVLLGVGAGMLLLGWVWMHRLIRLEY